MAEEWGAKKWIRQGATVTVDSFAWRRQWGQVYIIDILEEGQGAEGYGDAASGKRRGRDEG
jgi:hypothetical protein